MSKKSQFTLSLFIIAILALSFSTYQALTIGKQPLKSTVTRGPWTPFALISACDRWGRDLSRVLITKTSPRKTGRLDELEKIDFSLPDDPNYGDNPEMEFFNPEGPFHAELPPQELLDEETGRKNTKIVFNIRRQYRTDGILNDGLTVFIPDYPNVFSSQSVLNWHFELAPDNHTVVQNLGPGADGIFSYPDMNTRYFAATCFSRSKGPEDDEWWRP